MIMLAIELVVVFVAMCVALFVVGCVIIRFPKLRSAVTKLYEIVQVMKTPVSKQHFHELKLAMQAPAPVLTPTPTSSPPPILSKADLDDSDWAEWEAKKLKGPLSVAEQQRIHELELKWQALAEWVHGSPTISPKPKRVKPKVQINRPNGCWN
jgi:hypothetical protein